MIGLQMRINNTDVVVNVQAIRKTKTKRPPKNGEICTYEIRVYNQEVSEIECEYGSAVKLGHKMLEEYEKLSGEQISSLHRQEVGKKVAKKIDEINKGDK